MNSEVALITGSSSGIGLHLAHEFARNGHPLVLVAPDARELQEIATELVYKHGNFVRVIAKDLKRPGSAREIFTELQEADINVDILVNNAGHGFRGNSWDLPESTQARMNRKFYEEVPPEQCKRRRGDIEFVAASRSH